VFATHKIFLDIFKRGLSQNRSVGKSLEIWVPGGIIMLTSFEMVCKRIDAIGVDKTACGRRIDGVGHEI